MHKGSVIVDVAIDQGGSTEVSRPTSHDKPTYIVDDVIHYCVPNIPGDVTLTSTHALNKGILPYVMMLANNGVESAIKLSSTLKKGVNIINGHIVNKHLEEAYIVHKKGHTETI